MFIFLNNNRNVFFHISSKLFLLISLSIILLLIPVNSQAKGKSGYEVPDYIRLWGSADSKIIDFVYYFPEAPIDISTVLKLWQPIMKEYKKRLDFPRPLRVLFFTRREELDKLFSTTPVAIAFLPLDYYLNNKARLKIKPYSTFQFSEASSYSVSLIVKNSSKFNKLQDLKGMRLATTRTADNQPLFLTRIVFRRKIDVENFFSSIIYPLDSYSTIQSLRLNMADSALLPNYYIKVMKELDPSFSKKYREIFQSMLIPMPPFVYFTENITKKDLKVFQRVVHELNDEPVVKQALMFIKVKAVVDIDESLYHEVEKLWNK